MRLLPTTSHLMMLHQPHSSVLRQTQTPSPRSFNSSSVRAPAPLAAPDTQRDWIWTSFAIGAVSFSFAMLVYIWVLLTQFGDGWDIGIAGMCTVIFIFCTVVVFR